MLKTAALVTLALPLWIVGGVLSSSFVIVDVDPADGPRIFVPVPVELARAALAFAPDEARHVEIPEIEEHADVIAEVLDELAAAPDGVLVEVVDGDDHVRVAKSGDRLRVEVATDDEDVSVNVPLELARDIVDSYHGGELDTRDLLSALASVSRTDLVRVRTPEEEVKIWIW